MENIIDKICRYNKLNDSFECYKRAIFCIEHCLKLLDSSIFSADELSMLNDGIDIWHNKYNQEKLHNINLCFSRIWATNDYRDNKVKNNVMQAAGFVLTPFEGWEPEIYLRPFILEYFMGYMLYTNVSENDLRKVIINDYQDVIEFNCFEG